MNLFLNHQSLKALIKVFETDLNKEIHLASLMIPFSDKREVENPNNVKVIVDQFNCALYFSRSPIPFYRDTELPENYYKHIGVYAFRKEALLQFSSSEMTPLEQAEKLNASVIWSKEKMKMVLTHQISIGIDTPEDLKKAQQFLKS